MQGPSSKSLDYLLSLPQVVGVGYGLKEQGGAVTGVKAVTVLVSKKLPKEQLAAHELVPSTIEGLPTDVIEVGCLKAHRAEAHPPKAQGETKQARTAIWRPAPPGVSIGHYKITAGTFGAVVYERSSLQPLILSNNHVLANSSNGRDQRAKLNDPILQPGAYDLDPAPAAQATRTGAQENLDYTIARLHRYVPLLSYPTANYVDCAVAKPIANDLIIPDILGIGKVRGSVSPALGMRVQKSGRTSAVSYGTILVLNARINVDYGDRVLRFDKQIVTTRLSSPGDSGSLVLSLDNYAVGLLFAGSERVTVVNPIDPVLGLLKVRF